MSQEVERVYTINLGKAWLSPDNQRAKRAINMIKEFARHHMKTEQIRIDQDLSQAVWKRGIRSPPRKIRVKMAKTDEGHVVVSTYEEEDKSKAVEETSKDKKATKQPEVKVEPEAKIETVETKVEEIKEKPAKTEKKPESVKAPEAKKEAKPKKAEEKKTAKKSSAKKPAKKSK